MCRTGVKEVKGNAFKCVKFMSFGVVWKVAQILNKKDIDFWASATESGSAFVASAYCMLAKSIFMHNKRKEVRSSA